MTQQILILPGLYNSGPGHWQTLWQKSLPNARRVEQRDWNAPDRNEWVAVLDAAIAECSEPVILVAHSLGCVLVNWWSSQHRHAPHAAHVKAAFLVAPPNVERPDFPKAAIGFAPMPTARLPFKTAVVASSDDPYCALPKARAWAECWGASFHDVGPHGHLNAASNLRDWPIGQTLLRSLLM